MKPPYPPMSQSDFCAAVRTVSVLACIYYGYFTALFTGSYEYYVHTQYTSQFRSTASLGGRASISTFAGVIRTFSA